MLRSSKSSLSILSCSFLKSALSVGKTPAKTCHQWLATFSSDSGISNTIDRASLKPGNGLTLVPISFNVSPIFASAIFRIPVMMYPHWPAMRVSHVRMPGESILQFDQKGALKVFYLTYPISVHSHFPPPAHPVSRSPAFKVPAFTLTIHMTPRYGSYHESKRSAFRGSSDFPEGEGRWSTRDSSTLDIFNPVFAEISMGDVVST